MPPVEIVEGDLLNQPVEVIVNSWNRNVIPWWLLIPQGVSGAIKKRAGYQPFWEVGKAGPMPLGSAVLTSAGRLPFKGIIHVAGINLFWFGTEFSIRESTHNALRLAHHHQFQSIALPLIGSGSGSYSGEKSLRFMLEEIEKCPAKPDRVVLVKFKKG